MKSRTQLICWGLFAACVWAVNQFDWFHDTRAWLDKPVSNGFFILATVVVVVALNEIERKIGVLSSQISDLLWELKDALKDLGGRISFYR